MPEPILVAQRRLPPYTAREEASKEAARVPLEQRWGMLHIEYTLDLGFRVPKGRKRIGNVFPGGLHFWYRNGFGLYVEVLPRKLSGAELRAKVAHPPFIQVIARVRQLRLEQTPVVASGVTGITAVANPTDDRSDDGPCTSTSSDAHITLLKPEQLQGYLGEAFPLMGVAPSNMDALKRYVASTIEDGKRQLRQRQRR